MQAVQHHGDLALATGAQLMQLEKLMVMAVYMAVTVAVLVVLRQLKRTTRSLLWKHHGLVDQKQNPIH